MRIFNILFEESDTEWIFIDSSYIKAHHHCVGASNNKDQSIGERRGGNTSKIHLAVDSYGLPIHFEFTGGEQQA